MIEVKGREMVIPREEFNIGTTYDARSEMRHFHMRRVRQGGIDLAGLVFNLDLEYANGKTDTATLTKDVTNRDIDLMLTIEPTMLQVPGTVIIQIRALAEDGTVKWSSYKGAFFVEDCINTPAQYEGKITQLEQYEAEWGSVRDNVRALNSRMDEIVRMADGIDASDVEKEVTDVRVGADGKKYESAGSAVREQITAEKNKRTAADDALKAEFNAQITEEATARTNTDASLNSAIAIERARIDNLTKLGEGSTTGDAELQDIRVGADGKIYKTAGNAVRGQFGALNEDLSRLSEDIDNLQKFADYVAFPAQQGISKNINVANTTKIVTDSHSGSKIEMLACCNKSQSGTPTPTSQVAIPFAEKIKINIQSGNLASHYIKLTDKIIASNKDYSSMGTIKILPNVPYLLFMCADKGYADGLIYIFNSDMSVVTTFNLSYAENYKTCSFVAPENAAYMSYYSAVGRVDYSKPCLTIGYKYTGYLENYVDKEIEVQEVFGKIKEIKDTIESKQGRIVKVKRTHYQKVPIEKVTKSNFSNRFLISGKELDYLPKTESSASNCILSNFFAPTSKPYANDNCVAIESNNNISFGYDSSKSVDEFKEYFTNHPLYIMYPLKEEVVTFIANNDIELSESAAIYCDENLDMQYFYNGDEYKKGVNITLDSSISFDELKEIINSCVKRGVNAFALMTSDAFESNTSSVIKPIKKGVLDKLEKTIKYINLLGYFVTLRCACHSATNAGGENVTPEDLDTWFTTWENRIKSYLDIAYPLNVRYVAISNELRTLTGDSKYKPYWLRTINNLKGSYPNVKCAINFNIYDKNNLCLDLFDIIGFNCYPCLTRYGLNESDEILKSSFYNDLYNDNSIGKLIELNNLYPNKTIWISEIGTQSQENGLFQTWQNYYSPSIENQAVQSKYYELFFTMVDRVKNSGMFIWSVYDARDNGFSFLNKSAGAIVNKYWNNGMETM